jgi:hypothetical protein
MPMLRHDRPSRLGIYVPARYLCLCLTTRASLTACPVGAYRALRHIQERSKARGLEKLPRRTLTMRSRRRDGLGAASEDRTRHQPIPWCIDARPSLDASDEMMLHKQLPPEDGFYRAAARSRARRSSSATASGSAH